MSRRTSVIGIAVLFALALSAFASAGASAADRAYKCETAAAGTATFKDAHCKTAETGAAAGFKHTLITAANTAATGTNAKTISETTAAAMVTLKGHLAGVELGITCTTLSATGTLTNGATSVSGTGKLTCTGNSVVLPANKGCKVSNTIETTELK